MTVTKQRKGHVAVSTPHVSWDDTFFSCVTKSLFREFCY